LTSAANATVSPAEKPKSSPDPNALLAMLELVNRRRRPGLDDPTRPLLYAKAAKRAELVDPDNYEVENALRSALAGVIPQRIIDKPARIARFSPDGSKVLTVGNSVQVLSLDNDSFVLSSAEHTGRVTDASFSPAGDVVLTCSLDGTARIESMASSVPTRVLDAHNGGVDSCLFDSDGSRVLTAGRDKTARVWDARSGALIHELRGHTGEMTLAVFSNDGARILTGDLNDNLGLWDSKTGSLIRMQRLGFTPGLGGFSGDDKRFFVTDRRSGSVEVRDTGNGGLLMPTQNVNLPPIAASFDSSGEKLLVVPASGSAEVWRIGTKPEMLVQLPSGVGGAASGDLGKGCRHCRCRESRRYSDTVEYGDPRGAGGILRAPRRHHAD
jgi:WD40 repeat protein